jgi:hypothetical protein
MVAAGAGRAGANSEPAGEFGLAGGSECRTFLMPDANPFDTATANRVRKRVERVPD